MIPASYSFVKLTKYSWTFVDPEISGWKDVPKILFSLIPTIVPSLSLDKTSTFLETLFTIGARIKTALIFSCIPLKVISDSNLKYQI